MKRIPSARENERVRIIKMRTIFGICAIALALSTNAALAATLQVNSDGQLISAQGVNVGGDLFDVAFVDGTCAAVFDQCDDASIDFSFQTRADADAASAALNIQVFLNVTLGLFDSTPELTFGVVDESIGIIATPYELSGGAVRASTAQNWSSIPNTIGSSVLGITNRDTGADTGIGRAHVWAVWSDAPDVAPVPLPASVLLMLGAMGALGAVRRI